MNNKFDISLLYYHLRVGKEYTRYSLRSFTALLIMISFSIISLQGISPNMLFTQNTFLVVLANWYFFNELQILHKFTLC